MTHAENMRKNSPAEKVHLRREGKIAILELDNPDGGYLTAYMVQEIDRLTMALEADPAVRVIVLTGRIPGTFITHYSPRELTEPLSAPVRLAGRSQSGDVAGSAFSRRPLQPDAHSLAAFRHRVHRCPERLRDGRWL